MNYTVSFIVVNQKLKTIDEIRTPRSFTINYLNDYEIVDSIENLTKTCKITIPNTFYFDKKQLMKPRDLFNEIRYGDSIQIYSGYFKSKDNNNILDDVSDITMIFDGWVTKVSNTTPMIIEAQDHMFILKKCRCMNLNWDTTKKSNGTNKQGTLEQMIEYMFKNIKYEYVEYNIKTNTAKNISKSLWDLDFRIETDNTGTNIGKWILNESNSVSNFLEEIRSKCKFTVFLNNKTLFAGIIQYNSKLKQDKDLLFSTTDNIIENNIEIINKDECRIKVKAIGIQKSVINNKKKDIRVEEIVGDFDGDIRTWHSLDDFQDAYFEPGITNKKRSKKLREQANNILQKFKADRAKGSITVFGSPKVYKGNVVTVIDPTLKLKSGSGYWKDGLQFLVKGVTYNGGIGGLRQTIELDFRYDTLTDVEKNSYNNNESIYKN